MDKTERTHQATDYSAAEEGKQTSIEGEFYMISFRQKGDLNSQISEKERRPSSDLDSTA